MNLSAFCVQRVTSKVSLEKALVWCTLCEVLYFYPSALSGTSLFQGRLFSLSPLKGGMSALADRGINLSQAYGLPAPLLGGAYTLQSIHTEYPSQHTAHFAMDFSSEIIKNCCGRVPALCTTPQKYGILSIQHCTKTRRRSTHDKRALYRGDDRTDRPAESL